MFAAAQAEPQPVGASPQDIEKCTEKVFFVKEEVRDLLLLLIVSFEYYIEHMVFWLCVLALLEVPLPTLGTKSFLYLFGLGSGE